MVFRKGLRFVALLAAAAIAAGAAQAATLRVCTDPDNLPFSKADGPERGLYVELAELVGRRLGATPQFVWWLSFNQRKALRNTILQDDCDAYFALPADASEYKARGLQRTRAFLDVSYALVGPASFAPTRLDDLRGKRIGVLHGSPPHILLAMHEGYTTTSFREQREVLDAMARGEIDAALLWGPSAGYEVARRFNNRWRVTPVTGDGLGGPVAVAVRRGSDQLLAGIDRALADLQPEIQQLADKYAFPRGKPLVLGAVQARRGDRAQVLAQSLQVNSGWVTTADTAQPAASGAAADAAAGRTRFNNTCSHCHGTDGFSPVSERDLRKLKSRYKEKWRDTALTTIRNGRPELGMPTWKTAFSDKEIEEVIEFLSTIQR